VGPGLRRGDGILELELSTLALLALVGLAAGFIDSIAGGGALLSLPALLLSGLDPISAIATNKLQGTFGTASATHAFWRRGLLKPQEHVVEIATVLIGSALGVVAVSYAPTKLLQAALPILLIAIAIYFTLSTKLRNEQSKAKFGLGFFSFALAPMIGFYDGIFGPGTGSFFMLALVSLFGFGIIQATARTKLLNFTSNISALILWVLAGKVFWIIGLVMGVAQFMGAQIGAHVAIANGAKVIRPLLVLVCIALAVKLLADPANPLRALFEWYWPQVEIF
jgi:uncharacterized membrane protein YfcA